MHPRKYAKSCPEKAAYKMARSGSVVTYGELEDAANQGAHLLRSIGLQRGDVVALLLENNPFLFKIVWAAQRAGLYTTLISPKLAIGEVDYILKNSCAKVLVSSAQVFDLADQAASRNKDVKCFMVNGAKGVFSAYEAMIEQFPTTPIADESPGEIMLYSSGTTGRPKGVKPPLPPMDQPVDAKPANADGFAHIFGIDEEAIYLSPAPLYHAAPLHSCMMAHRFGATAIIMESFDPEWAIQLIEDHQVISSQWVPTHFVRMLKLPPEIREKYDVSSMRKAVHAAAPCPISIKEQMIAWWGPIIDEFYSGTEGAGTTYITSPEWMEHKGSVGRAFPPSEIHICDDSGNILPTGEVGNIYFSGGREFAYHNDEEKTAASRSEQGWTTLGDVGRLDEDGYLYLSDRKDFMIISGGVNIYPQEIENQLIAHSDVMDAAVFGMPDDEMGERVVAVIQPVEWDLAGPDLSEDIRGYLRSTLSHVKTPKKIDFVKELPRTPTGKLMKRLLRDEYLAKAE